MYTRNNGAEVLIVGMYVDDLSVTSTSVEDIKEFKQQMMKEFEMTGIGLLTYYLDIEMDQKKVCIMLKLLVRSCCNNLRWKIANQPSIP